MSGDGKAEAGRKEDSASRTDREASDSFEVIILLRRSRGRFIPVID